MRHPVLKFGCAAAVFVLSALSVAAPSAQTRTVPRTAWGKPDLSGIWQAVNTAAWNILPHPAEAGVPGGLGVVEGNDLPYRPEAAAKQRENYANRATLDPDAKCWLPGVPRGTPGLSAHGCWRSITSRFGRGRKKER